MMVRGGGDGGGGGVKKWWVGMSLTRYAVSRD